MDSASRMVVTLSGGAHGAVAAHILAERGYQLSAITPGQFLV